MASTKSLVILKDDTSKVFKALEALVGKSVFVGIPEANDSREDPDGKKPITNAALAYIHEFGSPEANIPARAWLIPGVQNAEKPALYQLRKAANAALDGDSKKAEQYLNAAGIVGANSARYEINNGDFVALQPATILNRNRSRGTDSHRKSELFYLALYSSGLSAMDSEAIAGIRPLINTAQMRNAVTYVIRTK